MIYLKITERSLLILDPLFNKECAPQSAEYGAREHNKSSIIHITYNIFTGLFIYFSFRLFFWLIFPSYVFFHQ